MSASLAAPAAVQIQPLSTLDSLQQCVDLQVAVWGYSDGDVVPRRMFLLASRIGGQVMGAVVGHRVVGFAMALPGYRDGRAYLHSHMLAVSSEFRNAGLGRRLKLAQRDDAIARGFDLMEWTFDPLEIKNAYLNIARLGAVCRRYQPDFYGPSSSPLQGGLPTDRLYAEWWLRSDRVRHILGEVDSSTGSPPASECVPVPAEVSAWKANPETLERARHAQHTLHLALDHAFARGLVVTGYSRQTDGGGSYLLGPAPDIPGRTPGPGNVACSHLSRASAASRASDAGLLFRHRHT